MRSYSRQREYAKVSNLDLCNQAAVLLLLSNSTADDNLPRLSADWLLEHNVANKSCRARMPLLSAIRHE